MEATIVIEINSGLDDKQKRYNIAKYCLIKILPTGCHIIIVVYCMKMLIKVNQIHTGSSNMHALSSTVISRLYIKYSKSYRNR